MPRRKRNFNFEDEAFFYDAGNCRSFNGDSIVTDIGKNSLGYNATNTGCVLELDSTINENRVIRFDTSTDKLVTESFAFPSADRYYVYLTIRSTPLSPDIQTFYDDGNNQVTVNYPKIQIVRFQFSNNLVVRYGRPGVASTDITYTNFFLNIQDEYINIVGVFIKSFNLMLIYKNGTRTDGILQSDALFPTTNIGKGIGSRIAINNNVYSVMNAASGVRNDANVGNILSTNLFQYRFRNLDPDTSIFIRATGITDPNIQYAVNELIKDLKQYGLWIFISALYPFVGGTSAAHSVNLKQPGIFGTITWVGGVTHDANGVTFNGTTGYGNCNFAANNINLIVNATNQTMGLYSRTSGATTAWDMGCNTASSTAQALLQVRSATDGDTSRMFGSAQVTNAIITDGSGLHLISRFGNNLNRVQNGVVLDTNSNTSTGTIPTVNYFIGARNNNGTPANYSNRNISLAIFAYNITSIRMHENLYKIVQKFQTLLGRQIGTPVY